MKQTVFQDMTVTWIDLQRHMVVRDSSGNLLFSSMGYVHPRLSPKEVKDLTEYYHQNKKSWDFGAQES